MPSVIAGYVEYATKQLHPPRKILQRYVFCEIRMEILVRDGRAGPFFKNIGSVKLDTGSAHFVLPTTTADEFGIEYSTDPDCIVGVGGAIRQGSKPSIAYFGRITIGFVKLPEFWFSVPCLFVPDGRATLLGMSAVQPYFAMETTEPTSALDRGGIALRLRPEKASDESLRRPAHFARRNGV
ncbi:MAG: retropepsin-like domain-containing protein [Planctomycetia bacterium]|nr:retropepsin-like domain-containing protein [Planctomycetia bacterium]